MCRFPASGSSWESLAQGSVSMDDRGYIRNKTLLFLPPAPESDSDFRLAPENQIITKLENLIFNHVETTKTLLF
jgi:hypothetical protein